MLRFLEKPGAISKLKTRILTGEESVEQARNTPNMGKILDQFGSPVSTRNAKGYGLYSSPRGVKSIRPRPYSVVQDTKDNLTQYDWWEQLNYSRQLFAQMGNLGGAIVQKNDWAFSEGWTPSYKGDKRKYGEWADAATNWLRNEWYPCAGLNGFDFNTLLFVDGIAKDVDGDAGWGYIWDEKENHLPQIQPIAAHRIGSRQADGIVKSGQFTGKRILNGIFYDSAGRKIGARILGDKAEQDLDLPIGQFDHSYEPEWCDQGRGIPRCARALLDCLDHQDIDSFLKMAVKLDSSIGVIRKVEGGEAVAGEDHIREEEDAEDTAEPQKLDVEETRGGEFWYMDAAKGENIEGYKSDRPHPNTEAFIRRIERRLIYSIGWFLELLDPEKIGGASNRLIADLAKKSIRQRQRSGRRRAQRAVIFALSIAMKTGRVPEHPEWHDKRANIRNADWMQWGFTMPGVISVDSGNDEAADRENLKLGLTNLKIYAEKKGYDGWRELVDGSDEVTDYQIEKALSKMQKYPEAKLTFPQALELIRQSNPNGAQPQPEQKEEKDEIPTNTKDA